jgi:uncharacterized BrkB/YihY/UPF0761 family membrane protein
MPSRVLATYNRRHGPLFAKGLGFSFVVGGMSLLFLALCVGAYLFHASPALQKALSEQLLGFLPPQIGPGPIEGIMDLASRWGSLGIITIAIFVLTSLALFDSLERTMATMLRARRRRFLVGRALSLLLLGATVLLFYATAALSVLGNYFSAAFALPAVSVYLGAKAAALLLTTGVFYVLYRLFARRRLHFWKTAAVAGIAALCWQLIGTVGAVLIRLAGRRFLIYGAIAWAVMIMVYVRVLGEIVVVSGITACVLNPPGQCEG